MTTDNTQELDVLKHVLLKAYYRGKDGDGYSDAQIKQDNQALLDWHNKQIEQAYSDGFRKASKGAFKSQQEAKRRTVEAVLDRLEVKLSHFGHDATVNIEAERNKLKNSTDE